MKYLFKCVLSVVLSALYAGAFAAVLLPFVTPIIGDELSIVFFCLSGVLIGLVVTTTILDS